jgi:hypothetical protein
MSATVAPSNNCHDISICNIFVFLSNFFFFVGEVSKFAEVFGPAGIGFHVKENCFFVSCHLDHSIKRVSIAGI